MIDKGMIPKVEACLTASKPGVSKVHIIDGRLRHSLLLEMYTDDRHRHRDRLEGRAATAEPRPARPGAGHRYAERTVETRPHVRPSSITSDRTRPSHCGFAGEPALLRSGATLVASHESEFRRDDRPVRSVRGPQLPALSGLPGPGRGVVGLGRRGEPAISTSSRAGAATCSATARRGSSRRSASRSAS